MDFYSFINRFELECKRDLYSTTKDKQEIEKELKEINREINKMKSIFRRPAPVGLTAGLVGGNMLGMLFALMFASNLWIAYLIALIIFSILGLANEVYERNWKEELNSLYTALKESYTDKHKKEVIESRLKSMINDIHTCYQYYFYMTKEEDRTKPISITKQEVYDSQCRLSTFLHEFYNGDIEHFRSLHPYQQIREEHSLHLNTKIREAKEEKLGLKEPIERPRRRMANRYYNQYVVAGNTALKR